MKDKFREGVSVLEKGPLFMVKIKELFSGQTRMPKAPSSCCLAWPVLTSESDCGSASLLPTQLSFVSLKLFFAREAAATRSFPPALSSPHWVYITRQMWRLVQGRHSWGQLTLSRSQPQASFQKIKGVSLVKFSIPRPQEMSPSKEKMAKRYPHVHTLFCAGDSHTWAERHAHRSWSHLNCITTLRYIHPAEK